jgi:hypothetical protein
MESGFWHKSVWNRFYEHTSQDRHFGMKRHPNGVDIVGVMRVAEPELMSAANFSGLFGNRLTLPKRHGNLNPAPGNTPLGLKTATLPRFYMIDPIG